MAPSYTVVPEDEEKLLSASGSEDGSLSDTARRLWWRSPSTKKTSLATVLHWIAHGTTVLLLMIILLRELRTKSTAPIRPEQLYSPAYPNRDQPLHHEVFKSAFWQNTIYKAYPNPPTNETLSAWRHLTDTPAMNLTRDEIVRLGLSPDTVQWPKSAGGGYIAYLESAHQLHCLEALWMRHHYDKTPELFPELKAKIDELPEIEEAHFEHCVDVIRQRLMCTADTSIVTFRWVHGLSTPYPNFHSGHMCADYEELLKWGEGRKADMSKVEGWDYHVNLAEGDVEIDHLPK